MPLNKELSSLEKLGGYLSVNLLTVKSSYQTPNKLCLILSQIKKDTKTEVTESQYT